MKTRRSETGSVLILALWSVAMLAVLAVTVGAMTRQKLTMIARLSASEALVPLAMAGVEQAKGLLHETDLDPGFDALSDPWASSNDHFREVETAEGRFSVIGEPVPGPDGELQDRFGMIDEQRKLNVNTADANAIQRLLLAIVPPEQEGEEPFDEEAALALAYAIVDWRDADSAYGHPEHGAEDDDYDDLKTPYEAKDSPVQMLEELLLVKGMTRAIFDRIEPFMTPYGNGAVNVNTASKHVLRAIGLNDGLVGSIVAYRSGPDAVPGTSDDLVFTAPDQIPSQLERIGAVSEADRVAVENMASMGLIGTASDFYSVRSRATLDGSGAALEALAVLDKRGNLLRLRFSRLQWPSRRS